MGVYTSSGFWDRCKPSQEFINYLISKRMKIIDMNRVREALPSRAYVQLRKKNSTPYIYIKIESPSMMEYGNEKQQEKDIEMIFDWLRDIVGHENVSEFYRHSTGSPWELWLKRNKYEFINLSNDDVIGFIEHDGAKEQVKSLLV